MRPRMLRDLVRQVKSFKGFTRKSILSEPLSIFGDENFDDAGAAKVGENYVVVSTDGIVQELVREDPWSAGFFSVLVNVNDVVAKGARPIGYVNVVSSSKEAFRKEIFEGIKFGLKKYRLQMLKGHTNPDTDYDSVDAAVFGVAKRFVPSSGARMGDALVLTIDLDGFPGKRSWVRTFDSVKSKSSEEVLNRLEGVVRICELGLVSAMRDISGTGIIGTLAMLCESSRVGATVRLNKILLPEGVQLSDWLLTYPAMGFIFSTGQPERCEAILGDHALSSSVVGETSLDMKIILSGNSGKEVFMDLERESVFGFKRVHDQG